MGRTLNILVNPAAGRGRARRIFPRISRRLADLRLRFKAHFSDGPGHLASLARDCSGFGCGPIVVCGGDGSLNEVINGLGDSSPALGILPCGSGNDLARNLGIPRDPVAACALLGSARARTLDAIDVGGRRYLGVGGAGFDAEVNRRANTAGPGRFPRLVYTSHVLRTLATYRSRMFRVLADGWSFEGRAMFVAVANAPCYGGGMRISPHSLMDDGRFEVCVVAEMTPLEMLANFPRVFSGRHVDHPRFHVRTARRVRIDSEPGGDYYADGERQGSLPVEIAVVPGAVRVIAPPGPGS